MQSDGKITLEQQKVLYVAKNLKFSDFSPASPKRCFCTKCDRVANTPESTQYWIIYRLYEFGLLLTVKLWTFMVILPQKISFSVRFWTLRPKILSILSYFLRILSKILEIFLDFWGKWLQNISICILLVSSW